MAVTSHLNVHVLPMLQLRSCVFRIISVRGHKSVALRDLETTFSANQILVSYSKCNEIMIILVLMAQKSRLCMEVLCFLCFDVFLSNL